MSQSVSYFFSFENPSIHDALGWLYICVCKMKAHTKRGAKSMPYSNAGFSLIELAIVLVILGIMGGMALPLLTAHITRSAIAKTRAHQDYALNAIAAFVEKHHRFPCPAEPHILGSHFGVAPEACRMDKAKGILPFKTLGISEIYAHDGFKRLMTYVVEPELSKRQINLHEEAGGLITVKTHEGISVLVSPKAAEKNPNYVAIVLISHGESGIGSYLGKGSPGQLISHPISPHKQENCNANFVFIEGGDSDDMIRWESRDQFLKYYVEKR
jgi:prepilin-type N-terminal cleavage/methylation domain-containing protein